MPAINLVYTSNTQNTSSVQTSQSMVLGTTISGTVGQSGNLIINTITVVINASDTLAQVISAINTATISNITARVVGSNILEIIGTTESIVISASSTTAVLVALGISPVLFSNPYASHTTRSHR